MLDEILCPDENVAGERARDEGIRQVYREVKRKLHFLDNEFQLLHPRGNHGVTSPVWAMPVASGWVARAGPSRSLQSSHECIIHRGTTPKIRATEDLPSRYRPHGAAGAATVIPANLLARGS